MPEEEEEEEEGDEECASVAASYVVLLHHVERLILARMGGPLPANTPVNLPNMQKTIMKHRPLVAEPCEPTLVWKVVTGMPLHHFLWLSRNPPPAV